MHIVEVLGGLGRGGAELSVLRRLEHQPTGIKTSVLYVGDEEDDVRRRMSLACADVVGMARPANGRALDRVLQGMRPDVVLVHTPRLAVRLLLRRKGVRRFPIVVVAHSDVTADRLIRRPLVNVALAILNHRADLHIAVSKRAARGSWCRWASRVVVCPLGSTVTLEDAPGQVGYWPLHTEIRIASICRFVKPKNLVTALRAVKKEAETLRAKGAHLVLVGAGPEQIRMEQTIHSLDIGDLVSVHPPVTDASHLLQEAHWLLVTSRHEGGPLTVFEAQLAGCRVAATRVGVVADVLAQDSHSIVVPRSNLSQVREMLRGMLASGAPGACERELRINRALEWTTKERSKYFYALLEPFRR